MSPSGTQVKVKVLSCLEQDVGRGSRHGRSARGSLLPNQTTRSRARSAIDPGSLSFEPVVESFGHFCGSGLCPEQERLCITTGVPEFCPLSSGTFALLPVPGLFFGGFLRKRPVFRPEGTKETVTGNRLRPRRGGEDACNSLFFRKTLKGVGQGFPTRFRTQSTDMPA